MGNLTPEERQAALDAISAKITALANAVLQGNGPNPDYAKIWRELRDLRSARDKLGE